CRPSRPRLFRQELPGAWRRAGIRRRPVMLRESMVALLAIAAAALLAPDSASARGGFGGYRGGGFHGGGFRAAGIGMGGYRAAAIGGGYRVAAVRTGTFAGNAWRTGFYPGYRP